MDAVLQALELLRNPQPLPLMLTAVSESTLLEQQIHRMPWEDWFRTQDMCDRMDDTIVVIVPFELPYCMHEEAVPLLQHLDKVFSMDVAVIRGLNQIEFELVDPTLAPDLTDDDIYVPPRLLPQTEAMGLHGSNSTFIALHECYRFFDEDPATFVYDTIESVEAEADELCKKIAARSPEEKAWDSARFEETLAMFAKTMKCEGTLEECERLLGLIRERMADRC